MPPPPPWQCNKVLKPNFSLQFLELIMVATTPFTYFGQASAFRHKLRKYFCIVRSDCITACPFSIKKYTKMSVFLCENRKNSLAAGGYAPRLLASGNWSFTRRPPVMDSPPLVKSWVLHRHCIYFCALFLC